MKLEDVRVCEKCLAIAPLLYGCRLGSRCPKEMIALSEMKDQQQAREVEASII